MVSRGRGARWLPQGPQRGTRTHHKAKRFPYKDFWSSEDPCLKGPAPSHAPWPPSSAQGPLGCSFPCSPSTSSLAIRMVSVTSEKTVGLMKRPLSSIAEPPHSSLAPSFFPLSIRSRILSNCFWSICKNTTGSTVQVPSGKWLPPYVSNNLQQGRLSYPKSSGQVVIHRTNVPWIHMFLRELGRGKLGSAQARRASSVFTRLVPFILLSKFKGESRPEPVTFIALPTRCSLQGWPD